MTEILHDWILGLSAAAVVAAVAVLLTPKGPVERVTRLVCGIMLAAVLVSPIAELDPDILALSLAEYREAAADMTDSLEDTTERLNRKYIEEECAAYILDEARALGMEDGQVEVSAKWGDGCWVPWEADLSLSGTNIQKNELRGIIEAELGIPAERQNWNDGG